MGPLPHPTEALSAFSLSLHSELPNLEKELTSDPQGLSKGQRKHFEGVSAPITA